MKIAVEELKPFDLFKDKGQRKWRMVEKLHLLPNDESIPESHRGCILIIYDGCKQMVAPKGHEVKLFTLPF